jgi:3-phenylpropionate/cinnamic acid dioxygenase small subunit
LRSGESPEHDPENWLPAFGTDHAPDESLNVQASDPSRSSYYVTDALYRELVQNFSDWQRDEQAVDDVVERERFRMLLEREARLLDQLRYENWLKLYARECIYWVPATPGGGDPRREVAVMFDDRRRLEDRVYRLRTGFAWSQAPASRTVRLITNVEVFRTTEATARMVRSNFLITEFWGDETRILSGWTGHRIVQHEGSWEIAVKQVNLLECDQSIRNPSIIL